MNGSPAPPGGDVRDATLEFVDRVLPSLSLRDAAQLARTGAPAAKKRRILVVDDEAVIAQTLRFNLEHAGYEVFCAFDGRAAIEGAAQHVPDLILLDVMLPCVDGFTACAAITARRDVPVILLTAKDSETDKIAGFAAGAADYLTKPFVLTELLARVRALLSDAP